MLRRALYDTRERLLSTEAARIAFLEDSLAPEQGDAVRMPGSQSAILIKQKKASVSN
jgi:hypothetical protein